MNLVDWHDAPLSDAKRVLVIGCSGAGKSTFSAALAQALGLPHIPMDRDFFWLPGWKLRDRAEIKHKMAQAAAGERWIMDGNSAGTLDIRLPRTELVIWFRLPRWLCIYRVLRRWWRHAGTVRPRMAAGCPEKIDLEFLRYIWNLEKNETPEITGQIETHRPDVPVVVLRRPADADALLARLKTPV